MRAVVLPAAKAALTLADDHPEPTLRGPDELVLDVTACGVCHSDIHVADGDFGAEPPIVLGHEVTGVHPELGPVMLYAPWGCRNCRQCAEGEEMICSDSTEAGLFTDGGYAQRMRVPHIGYLSPLDGLDPYHAAPLACGGLTAYRAVLHGVDRLRQLGADGRAVVIGAGGLGQYAIRYLRLLTDAQVTAVDLSETKQATALDLGAAEATGSLEPDTQPFDLAIDFIGAEATLRSAADAIAKRGTVAVVGLAGGTIPFGFGAVPLEASFVASVWGTRSQMDELLDLARREPSVLGEDTIEVVPLAEAQAAHEKLRTGDVRGRVVLDISGARTTSSPNSTKGETNP